MPWWKVAYMERYRKRATVLPFEILFYIGALYQIDIDVPYAFNRWDNGVSNQARRWRRFASYKTPPPSGLKFRVSIESFGRPSDNKQIIKVMANVKLKRKPNWEKIKKPKGWFFYKARRRGQQRYVANKKKSGGGKNGNDK